jgi:drug/metabolite transporter (DMT)-like permease
VVILFEEEVIMTNLKQMFELIILCLIWGINWVAIKISLEGLPPLTGAGLRFLIATLVLFFYVKWKRVSLKVDAREFRLLGICAFLTYAIDYSLIYWGEQYLSAGVTSIFFSTFALFIAFFSNVIFKSEAFNWRKYTGILIGFAGILIVFLDQLLLTRFSLIVILASLALVVSAISAAASTVMIKKYFSGMNPISLSFHQLWMGTVFMVLLAVVAENPGKIRLNGRVVWALLYMGVLASAVAFMIYYNLLKRMSAVSLSLTIYIIPIVALVTDYFVYGEVLHLRSFIGMFVIFSGIWLSQVDKKYIDGFISRLKRKKI